jgi:hypothetical protein
MVMGVEVLWEAIMQLNLKFSKNYQRQQQTAATFIQQT